MVLIQLTGLSGAGKSTLAQGAKRQLEAHGYRVEVLDGDVYRQKLWPELTFSTADRQENIRRLGFIGQLFCRQGIIVLLAAINPYKTVRTELVNQYLFCKEVFIDCDLPMLIQRDTKGLYARALLPDTHPNKLFNLTGINDPYEPPSSPDLVINTAIDNETCSRQCLVQFILDCMNSSIPSLSSVVDN